MFHGLVGSIDRSAYHRVSYNNRVLGWRIVQYASECRKTRSVDREVSLECRLMNLLTFSRSRSRLKLSQCRGTEMLGSEGRNYRALSACDRHVQRQSTNPLNRVLKSCYIPNWYHQPQVSQSPELEPRRSHSLTGRSLPCSPAVASVGACLTQRRSFHPPPAPRAIL